MGTYAKRVRELEGEIRLRPSLRSEQAKEQEVLPEYAEGR